MKPLSKILVVDDDADVLSVIRYCFESIPMIQLICVESGEMALETALKIDPDLILLDVMMPGMDGIATLQAFRLIPKFAKIPIVFLTAKAQKKEIEDYRKSGVDDVIVKPFDPLTLPKQVLSIWERVQKTT